MAINHDKLDCLYGPQVIDVIMKKPGKITIMIDQIQFIFNRVFISDQILQLVVSEFNT